MASNHKYTRETLLDCTNDDRIQGLAPRLIQCKNAIIVPKTHGEDKGADHAIFTPDGDTFLYRQIKRNEHRLNDEQVAFGSPPPGLYNILEGHYLYAGDFRNQFGLFLLESLSLVWALDHMSPKPDAVIFTPSWGLGHQNAKIYSERQQKAEEWLNGLGIKTKVIILDAAICVKNLVISSPGFTLWRDVRVSSHFRNFIRQRCATQNLDNSKSNSRKIYISRSKLKRVTGSIIGEAALEKTFRDDGYFIFHPQNHSLAEQLQIYRQAERIVGIEGSALHLPPFIISENCRVALISRRYDHKNLNANFISQYKRLGEITLDVIDTKTRSWQRKGEEHLISNAISAIDFTKTYDQLIELGYLSHNCARHEPSDDDISRTIDTASRESKFDIEQFVDPHEIPIG